MIGDDCSCRRGGGGTQPLNVSLDGPICETDLIGLVDKNVGTYYANMGRGPAISVPHISSRES